MADNTSFQQVYDSFLSKVTDDMYMELFQDETNALLQPLLLSAIPWFEFPRVDLFDYDLETEEFNNSLSNEEINIVATYMQVEWVGQQLASIENTRMKYSASDFKLTSQASHLDKLIKLKLVTQASGKKLQRIYKSRTTDADGRVIPTIGQIMGG